MLHEILLSLSGLRSPIWEQSQRGPGSGEGSLNHYLSPPEQAMLKTLAHLHDFHVHVRDLSTRSSSSHPSMVCRAVASAVAHEQLGHFRKHIVEVEASILRKDAGYVGAYEIVPLSTIVADFAPWTRRLEWLSSVVDCLGGKQDRDGATPPASGARVLDFLEQETHTGYTDLEVMALSLLAVGQKAWMQSAVMWILYGRLPSFGAEDFCIARSAASSSSSSSSAEAFLLKAHLTPKFLNSSARQSLLATGSALNQLRMGANLPEGTSKPSPDHSITMLPQHLKLLNALEYPLTPSLLDEALHSINRSISENALSQLLPLSLIMQLLQLISRYVLLDHGEFAVSLISNADERIANRHPTERAAQPVRKIGRLEDMAIKDAELGSILSRTFAELASLRNQEEAEDDVFSLARRLLSLRSMDHKPAHISLPTISKLLPSPTYLVLSIPSSSPLNMFVSLEDTSTYAYINAYLLSIYRARMHLSGLWKMTTQRRCHPTPLGPPRSCRAYGQAALSARRARESRRMRRTRRHWTNASEALFLMNELSSYLQGEVIQQSWLHFHKWLRGEEPSLATAKCSRPGTGSSAEQTRSDFSESTNHRPTDPRALASAHRVYLRALARALFLTHPPFLSPLSELLAQVDHFVALFTRLQVVWQGLDLQEDDGVLDAFSNFAQDEGDVLGEMDRTVQVIRSSVVEIVQRVRDVDIDIRADTEGLDIADDVDTLRIFGDDEKRFKPWRARTVDRLVMKLDGLVVRDGLSGDLVDEMDDE